MHLCCFCQKPVFEAEKLWCECRKFMIDFCLEAGTYIYLRWSFSINNLGIEKILI